MQATPTAGPVAVSASQTAARIPATVAAGGVSDLASVFGVKKGTPVESGFVFLDGVYIEAPYSVSRRGGDIYVNDAKIEDVVGMWPPPYAEDKDPGMPPGLTKDSTFKDLDFPDRPGDSWDRKKRRWLCSHFPPEEATRRTIEYYMSLPLRL